MPPPSAQQLLLSPAELAYLRSSLALSPPLRPDGRSPTQFRPLVAETDVLPSANGSARVCFADGTEAVVGVKAEVEGAVMGAAAGGGEATTAGSVMAGWEMHGQGAEDEEEAKARGEDAWVEMSVDMPGFRDDDALPTFVAQMLTEALLAGGALQSRLRINSRWHWKLYIDVSLVGNFLLPFICPLLPSTLFESGRSGLCSSGVVVQNRRSGIT
ncbi:hypothetical protein BDY21DRAFT_138960 [Lineolata rhizophorae]|uniref:Ribosomal RNA-processing protein 42 n=1 Tax=Lineolata rhizophorae TaxID=578093 RepID=A0A6A6PB27_9PEZI|nr:hypothetical protein BDY21DRAFT_138960 [Lineolata rhizophorae]